MTSLKQLIEYFHFRCKIQSGLPVDLLPAAVVEVQLDDAVGVGDVDGLDLDQTQRYCLYSKLVSPETFKE